MRAGWRPRPTCSASNGKTRAEKPPPCKREDGRPTSRFRNAHSQKRRGIPHQPQIGLDDDPGALLAGRHPAFCRVLLEV
ncbi:hypothetical protein B5G41_02610, partial [Alistipes onderdonkii]